MQISSIFGHFAIAFNRMMIVLCQFCVLFVIMFLPFVHIFFRLLRGSSGCPNQNFSSSIMEQYYNTFIILLNMMDFSQYKDSVSQGNFSLLLCVHVLYVFILSILLVNFLIALLSHSVSDVMEQKEVIVVIQQLVVVSIGDTYNRNFGFFRNRVQKRCFHVKGDKIYLVLISSNL